MRVSLVIYGNLVPPRSGGYLYDAMLVRQLRRRGHEVGVVSLQSARELSESLEVMARTSPDIIVEDELCHHPLSRMNSDLVDRTGARTCAIVHNLQSAYARTPSEAELIARSERDFFASVDALVFTSDFTRQLTFRRFGSPSRFATAKPGKDHFVPRSQNRDFAAGPLRVLHAASIIPQKGLDVLVEAVAQLPKEDIEITVTGAFRDRAFSRRLRDEIRERGLEKKVRFEGFVSRSFLEDLMARSHLLAVPSRCEGYGIVLTEALGMGLPVLACTPGGPDEIITDGKEGFLVPYGDARLLSRRLARLLRDRVLLQEMSSSALRRFQELPTWEKSLRPAMELLEGLAGCSG